MLLAAADRFERGRADAEGAHHFRLHDAHAAAADGAHGEFLLTGQAQFAHHHNVERKAELARNCKAYRHAPAWQGQHQHGWIMGVACKRSGQLPAGMGTLSKRF